MSEQAQLYRKTVLAGLQEYAGSYTASDEYLNKLKKDSKDKNPNPPPAPGD